MKYVLALVALLVASSYAAPGKILELPNTEDPMVETLANNPVKEEHPMVIPKGEEPMNSVKVTKGNENAIVEDKPEFWIPFYDFFSTIFQKKLPSPNAETKSLPGKAMRVKPNRDEFDDYNDYLDAHSDYLMKGSGESEESAQLVDTNSEEDRGKIVRFEHPEHVKDALLYNKVKMPNKAEFADYGDFLEKTNERLMPGPKTTEKPSFWSKWFSW